MELLFSGSLKVVTCGVSLILTFQLVNYTIRFIRSKRNGLIVKAEKIEDFNHNAWRNRKVYFRFTWNDQEWQAAVDPPPFAWLTYRNGIYYELYLDPNNPKKIQFKSIKPIISGYLGLISLLTFTAFFLLS